MAKKTDIQKEIDGLQGQITQLTKRRRDLQANRDELKASVQAQTQTIGSALLDGQDTTKQAEALARDRAKLEVLDAAVSQADERLRELNSNLSDKQRGLVRLDFDQVGNETYDLLLDTLDQLKAAIAGLDALEEKFRELNRVGQPAGITVEHDDHLRLAHQICMYLRGDFNSADGINYKLTHVEQNFPLTLEVARGKRNR